MKKIILVSSGQPSLNPRLVKEADSLAAAGYDVTVLYAYWNAWGTNYDKDLLSQKKWKAIRLGGSPSQKPLTYFLSRLIYKLASFALQKTGNYDYFADFSAARGSYFLIKGAKKHKADLYIAHNLGALAAAAKASQKHGKLSGFDAEDFHRQEVSDNVDSFNYKISKYLEDRYLPSLDYITASSPLISERYATLYNREVTTLLNVFPKATNFAIIKNENKPLKLFWFSQTIGLQRGIEDVLSALRLLNKYQFELHLLGNTDQRIKDLFTAEVERTSSKIHFHDPLPPDTIIEFANQFDIGLASENRTPFNRNICLTNKIFTYVQSGLVILASSTTAQTIFMEKYGIGGRLYEPQHPQSIADALMYYANNRDKLNEHKLRNFNLGQTTLNWEKEKERFLSSLNKVG